MRHIRPTKQIHRALFLALQADAKEFPGGIKAIAETMHISGTTLANGINPDHESLPPSFASILEIITVAQAHRTVYALAQLVGQVPMDLDMQERGRGEAIKLFLTLTATIGDLLSTGSVAATDGHYDAEERAALEPLLLNLLRATGELLQAIRG